MLGPAKTRFAGIAKDLRNLAPLPLFNSVIEVFKRPSQLFGEGPAHTALASAHEADKNHTPRPRLAAWLPDFTAKHSKARRFLWALSRPFPPNRFSLRFLYCFSERFLR